MSIIPMLRAAVIIRALLRAGFYIKRQKGSHVYLEHRKNPSRYATVAQHAKDISRKNLASILRQAQLPVQEFLKLIAK
jgi:predicted RNA binding protein YcfA (HicA-like mRNA interferase family)